jgi:hypothetical protein
MLFLCVPKTVKSPQPINSTSQIAKCKLQIATVRPNKISKMVGKAHPTEEYYNPTAENKKDATRQKSAKSYWIAARA